MPDTEQVQPPLQKVYDALVDKHIYSGSFDDFKSKYSSKKSIDELYNDVKVSNLFTKDKFSFYEKYFPEKREDASFERLHGAFKKAGYEGTEDDFKSEYKKPENISKLYQLAKQKEMFNGGEQDFVEKYFPSKAYKYPGLKKKEETNGSTDFANRFNGFPSGGGETTSANPVQKTKAEEPQKTGTGKEITERFSGGVPESDAYTKRSSLTQEAAQNLSGYLNNNKDNIIADVAKQNKKKYEFDSAMQSYGGTDNPAAQSKASQIANEIGKADVNLLDEDIHSASKEVEEKPLDAIAKTAKKKKDVMASLYLVRKQNGGNDEQILKNVEGIKSGELQYDPHSGQVLKPEGFLESIGTGLKTFAKNYKDSFELDTMSDEDVVRKFEEEKFDRDKPTPIPSGFAGQIGSLSGMLPQTVASMVAPEASPAIWSADMATQNYGAAFRRKYQELTTPVLDENGNVVKPAMDKLEAAKQAREAANLGAVVGATEGAIFGKVADIGGGIKSGVELATTKSLKAFGKNLLKKTAAGAVETGSSAASIGGLFGLGGIVEGKGGKEVTSDVLDNAGMVAAFGVLGKATGIASRGAKIAIDGFSKLPEPTLKKVIEASVQMGGISETRAAELEQAITDYKTASEKIPESVKDPEIKAKIADLILKRDKLEEKKKTEDSAFAPKTKEKIDAVNETILETASSKEAKKEPDQDELEKELAALHAKSEKPKDLESELEQLSAKPEEHELKLANPPTHTEVKPEEKPISEPVKEKENAIQESSPSGVLQHPQEGAGKEGGERSGVEQSVEGAKATETLKPEEGKAQELENKVKEVGKPEVKMEFIPATELRKAKDFDRATVEHKRIKDDFKKIKSLIDCLWS